MELLCQYYYYAQLFLNFIMSFLTLNNGFMFQDIVSYKLSPEV